MPARLTSIRTAGLLRGAAIQRSDAPAQPPPRRALGKSSLTAVDLALIDARMVMMARTDFWTFRRWMRPQMKCGWWIKHEARQLQQFYEDFKAGLRPKLVLSAPPQHGKTWSIEDFIAWVAGQDPMLALIFASYSDKRGTTVNAHVQRLILSPRYQRVFPNTVLPDLGDRRHVRNSEYMEFVPQTEGEQATQPGSFRNTTVRGAITGEGLRLGIIDDPVKGRAEVKGETNRNMLWEWFTDDFFTRFSDDAGFIMLMTRWHVDDPAGRVIKHFPDVKVLNYQAIADANDWSVIAGFRKAGEALFPEFKSKTFLLLRKAVLTIGSWLSLYQGSPIVVGGGIFPIEKFGVIPVIDRKQIVASVRYWDKAATKGGSGSESAGVLMHLMSEESEYRYVIEHVAHGRWSALVREQIILKMCRLDNRKKAIDTYVEREPGSGGKESAEHTIRLLAGFNVYEDRVTGDKETRAEPYAAQVQGGNVAIVEGQWNTQFLDEHESFPNAKLKDMVDGAGGAFAKLTVGAAPYDLSGDWIGEAA